MKRSSAAGIASLGLAAFIWGSTFVAQSVGMDYIGPFTYNGVRFLLGAAALLPLALLREIRAKRAGRISPIADKKAFLSLCAHGALLGAALFAASSFQQAAFLYTEPGKIAFITALYMLFVPLLGLPFGKRVPPLIWACVALGGAGMYVLSMPAGGAGSWNRGDLYSLACALLFAVQILLVERFAPRHDAVTLSCAQFFVSGALACCVIPFAESPSPAAIRAALWTLLYAGLLSCGVAYTLQMVGQKRTESTLASLIMCTESVFGVLSAAVALKQFPSPRETLGCVMMFAAIIAAQFAGRTKSDVPQSDGNAA